MKFKEGEIALLHGKEVKIVGVCGKHEWFRGEQFYGVQYVHKFEISKFTNRSFPIVFVAPESKLQKIITRENKDEKIEQIAEIVESGMNV